MAYLNLWAVNAPTTAIKLFESNYLIKETIKFLGILFVWLLVICLFRTKDAIKKNYYRTKDIMNLDRWGTSVDQERLIA